MILSCVHTLDWGVTFAGRPGVLVCLTVSIVLCNEKLQICLPPPPGGANAAIYMKWRHSGCFVLQLEVNSKVRFGPFNQRRPGFSPTRVILVSPQNHAALPAVPSLPRLPCGLQFSRLSIAEVHLLSVCGGLGSVCLPHFGISGPFCRISPPWYLPARSPSSSFLLTQTPHVCLSLAEQINAAHVGRNFLPFLSCQMEQKHT